MNAPMFTILEKMARYAMGFASRQEPHSVSSYKNTFPSANSEYIE
jgi:hypothetical protein